MSQQQDQKGANLAGLRSLQLLVSSGEPLTLSLLRQLDRVLPAETGILNLYGSTEVAADCTSCDARDWLHWREAEESGRLSPIMTGHLPGEGPFTASHLAEHSHTTDPGSRSSAAGAAAGGSSSVVAQAEGAGQVPVGWPIDNTAVFIAAPLHWEEGERSAGEAKSACSVGGFDIIKAQGALGEVCVAGVGVADGYHWCESAKYNGLCMHSIHNISRAASLTCTYNSFSYSF